MSYFSLASVQPKRQHGLHDAVHRNKDLKVVALRTSRVSVQDAVNTPRPPVSARNAEDVQTTWRGGSEPSFRRPLNSARGRLETHGQPGDAGGTAANLVKSYSAQKAAGGRPDHSSIRKCDTMLRGLETQNTGKGYSKESLHETQWGVDVGAEETINPMIPHLHSSDESRRKWAQDGRRKRFHRRHQTFSDINQYEHFNCLNELASTPGAQRAVELERQICDGALTVTQKSLLR